MGWAGRMEIRWEVGAGGEPIGGLKHPFRLKKQCCTFSMGHKLIQFTREAKTVIRSSLHSMQSY